MTVLHLERIMLQEHELDTTLSPVDHVKRLGHAYVYATSYLKAQQNFGAVLGCKGPWP